MAFTDHVQAYLGGLSGTVGWDINSLNLVVSDALLLYGVATEAEATDTTKAYALLDYSAARRILRESSMNHNYSMLFNIFLKAQVRWTVWTSALTPISEASCDAA
jgi:hypothetical protein